MATLCVVSETLAKIQQQPISEVKVNVPVTGFIHEAKDVVVFSQTTYKKYSKSSYRIFASQYDLILKD